MRRLLFLCLFLMATVAAFAQRGVAILPFSVNYGIPAGEVTPEMQDYTKKIGVFLQEALYNSIYAAGDTLQPAARTNKLLLDAGIEPDQPYYLDKAGLCILLKVKYLIAVQVTFGKGADKAKKDGGPDWYKLTNDLDKSRGFRLEIFGTNGQSAWDYKENFSWNELIVPNSQVIQPETYVRIRKQIEGFLQL
ncbi:hypothetical protein [Chitinophaga sancti]|uniref:DUF4136 domain-containing protein n=1 Tax=Chitinophaga sancti TaxID=1004 RepID=A0A1K1NB24_9BACT|nr:hypothetical protein [Chitinophaga sancti]WQD63465.1 hypothetical protein U0033_03590 [Chitinophaga sancti]WQG90909.1 hypothetical protein SR876_05325 [Chitinophaga sancti]SFW31574.1 hypothetical protein SAMN05661012_01056 [Chitinophaga sancti]